LTATTAPAARCRSAAARSRSLLKMPAPVRTEVSVTGPEAADREGIRW
jgi:hypothetical protein